MLLQRSFYMRKFGLCWLLDWKSKSMKTAVSVVYPCLLKSFILISWKVWYNLLLPSRGFFCFYSYFGYDVQLLHFIFFFLFLMCRFFTKQRSNKYLLLEIDLVSVKINKIYLIWCTLFYFWVLKYSNCNIPLLLKHKLWPSDLN